MAAEDLFNQYAEIGYEDAIQRAIDCIQLDSENKFEQGFWFAFLRDRLTVKPATIAADTGCSAAQVRELIKTWQRFPTDESRAQWAELTYYHFRLVKDLDSAEQWLDLAHDRKWSTRELQLAIKGEVVADHLREAEKLYGKIERLLDRGGQAASWLRLRLSQKLAELMTEPSDGQPEDIALSVDVRQASFNDMAEERALADYV